MLDIGRPSDKADVSRLSDAQLVAQLADPAKQLGIEIDLNYRFPQASSAKQEADCKSWDAGRRAVATPKFGGS